MQKEIRLAQRLAVVGEIDHRGVDLGRLRLRLQPCDQRGQHMVGVEQRVVVGTGDRGVVALAQVIALAGRLEAAEALGVAAEIGRAVVAQHVQHDDAAALGAGQPLVQTGQQRLVEAAALGAQPRRVDLHHLLAGQAVADALAAGLVVAPQHVDAGPREHMQQRLAAADAVLVVVAPAHRREHARHRDLGVGAAAGGLREVDQAGHGRQLWRGLARMAVQAPVGRPCGLADDQHHPHRPSARAHARPRRGVQPDRLARPGRALEVGGDDAAGRPQHVGRRDQVAQLALVAHQRRQRPELDHHRRHQQHQRAEQPQPARQRRLRERAPAQRQPRQERDRQRGLQPQAQRQRRPDQLAGLGRIGAQRIAQHRRIEVDAEGPDEVGAARGDQDQQRRHRLEQPTVAQQAQHQEVQRQQRQRQRQAEAPGGRIAERAAGQRLAEEGGVGAEQQERADGQQQPFRRPRSAPGRRQPHRGCKSEEGEKIHAVDTSRAPDCAERR